MKQYRELVRKILVQGETKVGRNGNTLLLLGMQLKFDAKDIPLLNGRKIYYKSVIGEFAAFMHDVQTIQEFKDFGCNYWDAWGDKLGNVNLDYVNQLHKTIVHYGSEIFSQLDILKINLKNDPNSRRHMINLWVPENVANNKLSLPCCHYSYQFIVTNNRLDMIWNQRSADTMVGVPADMILAWLWVQCLCKELGYEPGEVTMNFGDTHIYTTHIENAHKYADEIKPKVKPIAYLLNSFKSIETFKPSNVFVQVYEPHEPIKFDLIV